MSGGFRARLFAAALLVPAAMAAVAFAPQPAMAQDDEYGGTVGFRYFYDRLAPYGDWFESGRWGYVWQPREVDADFRPYYDGHWVYTDRYGWYWVSDEDWGDVVYHYGRWVYDPDDGWLWIPGYVWAPAWVIWRQGEGSTGWFPMPPDDDFFAGDESYRSDWSRYGDDDYYGYSDWYGPAFAATFFSLWVFVGDDHFGDRHFHRYARHDRDDRDDEDFFRRTRDATHYAAVDNYIVNRGVDPDALRRRTGQRFAPVPLSNVLRHDAPRPTPVDLGHRIQRREIQARPNLMPSWFRRGETLQTPRVPGTAGPQNLQQNPPPKIPRFPGVRTPDGTSTPPPDVNRTPRNWRDRFQRTTPPPVTPGVTPDGGAQPDNVYMPRNLPAPPVVKSPTTPPPPKFERRDWRQNVPATNAPATNVPTTNVPVTPPTPPEPRRFERFQPPPDNTPANLPARRFERVPPPPPPPPAVVNTPPPPPPPPPAVMRTPPPATTKAPPEDRNPRDHPRRDDPPR